MTMIEGQKGGLEVGRKSFREEQSLQQRSSQTVHIYNRTCDHFMNFPSGITGNSNTVVFVLAAEH